MAQLTKEDLKQVLKEVGVVTKDNLKQTLKDFGVVTETTLKRELNKTKKELIKTISNVAVNSPTINQHASLEKRVGKLEVAVN